MTCWRSTRRTGSEDPSLLARAREIVDHDDRYRSKYADVWGHLLDAGPVAVVAVLTSAHPDARPLKTDSPFSLIGGLIDQDQRAELVDRVYNPVRLWLLKPVEGLPEDEEQNPWEEWWERVHGMVVRATNEEEARRLAHEATHGQYDRQVSDGSPVSMKTVRRWDPWLDPDLSTCEPLDAEGPAGVILADYWRG